MLGMYASLVYPRKGGGECIGRKYSAQSLSLLPWVGGRLSSQRYALPWVGGRLSARSTLLFS